MKRQKVTLVLLMLSIIASPISGCATSAHRTSSSSNLSTPAARTIAQSPGPSTLQEIADGESDEEILADFREIEKNKKTAVEFYNLTFNQHKPAQAAEMYVGETYTQHNPKIPDGINGFVDFLKVFFRVLPNYSNEIKKVTGDKNYIFLHSHAKRTKMDTGQSVVDIFRFENGKIVEHWDILQNIPLVALNRNTMF